MDADKSFKSFPEFTFNKRVGLRSAAALNQVASQMFFQSQFQKFSV